MSLASLPSQPTYGQTVTLTATVTGGGATVNSGTVTFRDGASQIGSAAAVNNGQASVSYTLLSLGAHNITAVYSGDGAGIPQSTSGTLSLGVNPAPLTITADNRTRTYGGPLPTLTASYSGFINGDTPASLASLPILSTTATAGSPVGTYSIVVGGAVDPNYTIIYVGGTLSVTPAPLTIIANGQTKLYGATLPILTASYSGFVNGDTAASLITPPTLSTTATAASQVSGGPYPITASGATAANYAINYVGGSLTVTPAPLTITADSKSMSYGGPLPALTASYSGFVNGDTSDSLTTQPALTTTATAASHVSGSPYPITASGAADSDYTISYVGGSLTVIPAPLTITADNKMKSYGATVPTLTASYSGFVNGDTAASLTAPPTVTTAATAASQVSGGPYAVTAGGAATPDYTISYVGGWLTVAPAPLTITADGKNMPCGGPLPALTASYSGFVNGDTPASLQSAPNPHDHGHRHKPGRNVSRHHCRSG